MQSKTNTCTSSLQKCKSTWCCKKHKCYSDKSKAALTFVALHQLRRACGVIECSPRAALHPSVVSDPLLSNQLSADVICFITVLVGINDSGGLFHSSRCAATAAGCCQRLRGRRKTPLPSDTFTVLTRALLTQLFICTARTDKMLIIALV